MSRIARWNPAVSLLSIQSALAKPAVGLLEIQLLTPRAVRGDYSPVLAKHSKHLSLEDTLSIGVDRMQRNFEPMRQQVESWRAHQLSDASAKLTIYRAFIEGDLDVPKHLARSVHDLYFDPQYEEFQIPNYVEPVERIHICIQRTRSDSPIQGDSEVGGVF